MPSKPLLGSPVAVGISDAVMAMRSVVSAIAKCDDRSAVSSAAAQKALRMGIVYLRPTVETPCGIRRNTSKFQASHFAAVEQRFRSSPPG